MPERAKTIATCSLCGRGFVYVSEKSDMIDHYPPQKRSHIVPNENNECGGKIEILPEPVKTE